MKLKKVLASILAVAMLLSLANIAVLAEDETVFDAAIGDNYYENIADAIKAAQDGDTITIFAGEYKGFDVPENKNNLTFVGETDADGNNLVTIKTLDTGITSHNGGIFVGSETTTFKNLNFTAGTTPGASSSWMSSSLGNTNGDTGMRSLLKNLTVENCNFTGSGAYQAIWTNQGNVTVKNSTITKYDTAVDTYGIGAYQKMEIENTEIADVRNAFHTGEAKVGSQIVVTKTTIDSDVIDIGGAVAVTVEESTIKNAAVTTYASSTFAVSKSALYDTTYAVDENATGSITLDAVYANNVNELATNAKYENALHKNSANVTIFTYYADEEMTKLVDRRNAMVIETAKSTGATIMLNNLSNQSGVDIFEDATYQVVVSSAPASDVEKANGAIASNNDDTNTEKAIFDISVMKTDSNGTETDISGTITYQDVTLTLSETPANDSVKVYHVNGTNVDEITDLSVSGNTVTFVAPSFSTYAVTYTPTTVSEDEITDKIGVVFSPVAAGSNQYYITLKSLDGNKIYRYMSADIAFKNNCATVGYDIEPAANMTASVASVKDNSTEYHFEMDGTRQSSATSNDGITIGTITFYGYGTLDFSVDKAYTSNHAINIVNTAEAVDNIVANYTIGGATKELIVNELKASPSTYGSYYAEDENGMITDKLAPETKNLTINVKFNNIISDNVKAYQDMKVTVSGGDLTSPIVKNFGSDGEITLNGDTYTVEIADTLTQNVNYSVKVEGAGYRTARHIVTMTENKVLNFWNNVKDSANATVIETGKTAMTKNFLAGDIVKDNNINIYDLSAVVSYFGTENLVSAHPEYAKYDLNRDGVIDSKDVAYVLVSWGE